MTSDEPPTLREVDLIKWKDGSEIKEFRLIEWISNTCEDISTQLNIPKPRYESWRTQRLNNNPAVCHAVLQHWLESGAGRSPVAWSELIEILNDVRLGEVTEVAKKLETALLNKAQD